MTSAYGPAPLALRVLCAANRDIPRLVFNASAECAHRSTQLFRRVIDAFVCVRNGALLCRYSRRLISGHLRLPRDLLPGSNDLARLSAFAPEAEPPVRANAPTAITVSRKNEVEIALPPYLLPTRKQY